jgi:hypothetical protein
MLPILVWLAGVATAAASANQREQRHRALMEALAQRLGVKADEMPIRHRIAPLSPGIPIWVWEDGDRIVRLITEDEAVAAFEFVEDGGEHLEDATFSLRPDPQMPDLTEGAGWSVFAYLDEFNRPHAVVIVDHDEVKDLVGFAKRGDESNLIGGGMVRSRVFQFLQDHGLADSIDESTSRKLWHDDILVRPGAREIIKAILEDQAFMSGWEEWLDEVKSKYGIYGRDYAVVFAELWEAFRQFEGALADISHLHDVAPRTSDLWNKEFFELLEDSDWQWRLEDDGFDWEQIERAYEGDEEAREDLEEQGFTPERYHQTMLEWKHEDYQEQARDLWNAVKKEAEEADQMMVFHTLNDRSRYSRDGYRWDLDHVDASLYSDSIVSLEFDTGRLGDWANWEVGGHSSQTEPGFLPALFKGNWAETEVDLYDKAPEEPVWVYPGDELPPRLEAMFLLDEESFSPLAELDKMLPILDAAGLLSPAHREYWKAALEAHLCGL